MLTRAVCHPRTFASRLFAFLLVVGVSGIAANAQDAVDFPFDALGGTPLIPGTVEYQPDAQELWGLVSSSGLIMGNVPLPGYGSVTANLERIETDYSEWGIQVNGIPTPYDSFNQTIWKGSVAGDATSEVLLILSSYGCYGWINTAGKVYHFLPYLQPGLDWGVSSVRIVPDTVMRATGTPPGPFCLTDTSRSIGQPGPPSYDNPVGQTLECKVAVETDFEYYSQWNDLLAVQNYTTALLGAISDRYTNEINVRITYPYVQFYTSNNDPWTTQAGGPLLFLTTFKNAWAGNIPGGAHLGHFLSGVTGGGYAFLDVLCNSNFGFGVSFGISGGVSFPVNQGSNTWDFVVVSHELGHNFGSPHTHDWCPTPLDSCADAATFGDCQTSQQCISTGTIMSYCQLCPGGLSNHTTYFHTEVKDLMRAKAVASCLPNCDGCGCTEDCSVSLQTITHGDVILGNSSVKTFNVTNTSTGTGSGCAEVTYTVDESSPHWTVSPTTFTLLPDEWQSVTVVYSPQSEGGHSVEINVSGEGCENIVSASGTGQIGCVYGCDVGPLSLEHGLVPLGGSNQQTFEVTNTSTGFGCTSVGYSVTEISPHWSVSPMALFLAPGSTETVTVTFSPLSAGSKNVQIIVTGDECSNIISASGEGQLVCSYDSIVEPVSLAHGDIAVGSSNTAVITVTNTTTGLGCPPVLYTVVDTSTQWTVSPANFALESGMTQELSVIFTPQLGGIQYVAVSVFGNGCNQVVYATGEGTGASGGGGSGGGGNGGGGSSSESKSKCFIATAAYGSGMDPHVQALRGFRDTYMLTNAPGRMLIVFYERTSPPIAAFIAKYEWLRTCTRVLLTPILLAVSYPGTAACFLLVGLMALLRRLRRRRGARWAAPAPQVV